MDGFHLICESGKTGGRMPHALNNRAALNVHTTEIEVTHLPMTVLDHEGLNLWKIQP